MKILNKLHITNGNNVLCFTRFTALFFITLVITTTGITSCEQEEEINSFNENIQTIGQYLDNNREQFAMSYKLLNKTGVLNTLYAYNPYGDGYTLFLPNDEALNRYIDEHSSFQSLEEMLADTAFSDTLASYHVVKGQFLTQEFPFGAFIDSTFTGDRLTIGFDTENDNPLYKINNTAPVIEANLKMTNGIIHVISKVLNRTNLTAYDWLQQQEEFSILASAMEITEIKNRIWMDGYTILAEPDSVYHKYGIETVDDLIEYIPAGWKDYTNKWHPFHRFVAFHILQDAYYLNDLDYGGEDYHTLDSRRMRIVVGKEVQISPGTDTFSIEVVNNDTTLINYVGLDLEKCNIQSTTGPIHFINEILDIRNTPGW